MLKNKNRKFGGVFAIYYADEFYAILKYRHPESNILFSKEVDGLSSKNLAREKIRFYGDLILIGAIKG